MLLERVLRTAFKNCARVNLQSNINFCYVCFVLLFSLQQCMFLLSRIHKIYIFFHYSNNIYVLEQAGYKQLRDVCIHSFDIKPRFQGDLLDVKQLDFSMLQQLSRQYKRQCNNVTFNIVSTVNTTNDNGKKNPSKALKWQKITFM